MFYPGTSALAIRSKSQDSEKYEAAFGGPPGVGDTDEDYGEYTTARYAVQNDHYNGLYKQWAKPIYFLVGKHWLLWDDKRSSYVLDSDVPAWRQQPVTNFVYAVYRAAKAKLTKARPTLEVVPPSGDSEDRDVALLGQSILEHLWRFLKKPRKVDRALGWLLTTGNVFFCVDWDPKAGEVQQQTVMVEVVNPDDPTGESIDVPCASDESGEPYRRASKALEDIAIDGGLPYDLEKEPELVPTGEVLFEEVDPLAVRYNPEATNDEDATEMFVGKLWPLRKVCETFDLEEDDVQTSTNRDVDGRDDLEDLMSSVSAGPPDPFTSAQNTIGSSQAEGIGERVMVIKYYAKQDAAAGYPNGRHWIVAGGKKVWPAERNKKEFPDGEAELPFGFWPPLIPLVDTPIPGQPQGIGMLSQVVPLNEQINYLDAKIGEYHTTMAMGGVIWVAPEDKGISITSEPGQVKVSKGYGQSGKPPIREALTALPGAVYQERPVLENKLRTVAGLSQVDMQQKPEGVTAGRAFLVLQEASDAPFAPTLQALEDALCEVGRRELVIVQQKYTEPRTLKIRGGKGKYEFRSFIGSDLKDGLDVRVQVGSSFPWSKSAQWDTKLSILQALPQLILKPDGSIDETKLARYLDSGVPGLEAFESQENPDLVEIQREHAMFEAFDPMNPSGENQLPQLAFWQNQVVHQEQHFQFMKTDRARFERWSQQAQVAFIEHMRMTTEAVMQLLMQATPAPAGATGEGEEGGGAESGEEAPPPTGRNAPGQAPGGAKRAAGMTPHGGEVGRDNVPKANKKESNLRLTRADRRAAGQ